MTGSDLGTDRKRGLEGKGRVVPGREGISSGKGRGKGAKAAWECRLGQRVAAAGLFGKHEDHQSFKEIPKECEESRVASG